MSEEITLSLCNKKGLHARAAAKFVKTVSLYEAQVQVSKIAGAGVVAGCPCPESSGGSILGLMMLGAECGSTIQLRAEGRQARDVTDALRKLVEEKFGEE